MGRESNLRSRQRITVFRLWKGKAGLIRILNIDTRRTISTPQSIPICHHLCLWSTAKISQNDTQTFSVRILSSLAVLLLFAGRDIDFSHCPTGSVHLKFSFSDGVENGWLPRIARQGSSIRKPPRFALSLRYTDDFLPFLGMESEWDLPRFSTFGLVMRGHLSEGDEVCQSSTHHHPGRVVVTHASLPSMPM